MSTDRVKLIETCLTTAFSPQQLLVKDQSHLHAGHAGASDGRGHFDVTITAEAFEGLSRLKCHKLIYAALDELMVTDIHALRINASAKKADLSR